MIKVSVIIPVYNEEMFLRQCLDSLLTQTLKEIEIICVDDGSTDNSLEILHQYEKNDSRVQVIMQKKQYAGVARNKGLDIARGKYLLFLDADDYFEDDMIEILYECAEGYGLDIAICQYNIHNNNNGQKKVYSFEKEESFLSDKHIFSGNEIKENAIFQLTTGVAWDKLFRTEFVRESKIRFQNLRCSNDGFFAYCLMAIAKRISYIKKPLVNYRIGNKYSLSNTREKSWENAFTMLEAIKNELIKRGCYDCYQKSFLNYALTHGIGYLESINTFVHFKNCFYKIKKLEIEEFHLLEQSDDFFYNVSIWNKYKKVNELKLEEYLFEEMMKNKKTILDSKEYKWIVPYEKLEKDKKIGIYGAGNVGHIYYKQLVDSAFTKQIVWVDKEYKRLCKNGYQIYEPKSLLVEDVDYVIIAIANKATRENVKKWLLEIGISQRKIVE